MAESPIHSKVDFPTFSVLIEGKEIKAFYPVLSITIDRDAHKVSRAKIVISDGDPHEGSFSISELTDFDPGKKIEIKLGYHNTNKTVFKGVISAHDIRVKSYSNRLLSLLELTCKDDAFKLTGTRNTATFLKNKDSQVIQTLAQKASLTCTVDATTFEHPWLIQHDCTDWDFINLRAQANGLIVFNEDGKLDVKKPVFSGSAALKVEQSNVLSFKSSLSGNQQLKKITLEAWDSSTQKLVKGESTEPTLNAYGVAKGNKISATSGDNELAYTFSAADTQGSLKSLANGLLLANRLAMYKGEVSFVGSDKVKLGGLLTLEGFGKRFNGDIYITGYTHEIRDGFWKTTVRFGLSSVPYQEDPAYQLKGKTTSGLASVDGLHIGVVKKMDTDPDGMFRVQVAIESLNASKDLIWARFAQPYATNKAGFFFYPEVNDEVLIGFLNQDPRNAVILGSLYSKKNAPAVTPADKNYHKSIVTNAQLKISFDDEKKITTIETPGEQKITLSDEDKSIVLEDQHQNTITMDDKGIKLDTKKDLVFNATGSVKITSKKDTSINATSDVKIDSKANVKLKAATNIDGQGLQVAFKASTKFAAEGSAQTEIKSGGILTMKGSLVQIN